MHENMCVYEHGEKHLSLLGFVSPVLLCEQTPVYSNNIQQHRAPKHEVGLINIISKALERPVWRTWHSGWSASVAEGG